MALVAGVLAVMGWAILSAASQDGPMATQQADEAQGSRSERDGDNAPTPGSAQDRHTDQGAEHEQAPSTPREILWSGSFEGDDWTESFGVVEESRTYADVVSEGPDDREDLLRITFGGQGDRWGIDYRMSLDELGLPGRNAVELSYDAYFAPDFEFIGDGKFGGLAGIAEGVDPLEVSSGGSMDEGSFSARAMWKADRGVVGYLYVLRADGRDVADPDNYGFGIQVPFVAADGSTAEVLSTGVWHRITHRVALNTPGEANGIYQLEIDGHRGIDLDDVEFRGVSATQLFVNQIMSSWFFGGGADQFPTRPSTAYTADWTLSIADDLLQRDDGEPGGHRDR